MYNIQLADPQLFTVSNENELFFQSWSSDAKQPLKVFYVIGEALPNSIALNVAIENHFATEEEGKYSGFYARAFILQFSGNNDNFEVTAGDMTGQPDGLRLTPNNLNQEVQLSFQNFSLTTPGNYEGFINFNVHGIRQDSGTKEFLSVFKIDVELEVVAQKSVMLSVDEMYLSHIKTQASLPPQSFEVLTGIDFDIFVPSYFELSGGNILAVANTANSRNKYSGSGRQTLNISIKPEFDFYEYSIFTDHIGIQVPLTVPGALNIPRWQTVLTAYLLDEHGFISDPETLSFFSIKEVKDATSQTIEIIASQDYEIEIPFWLTCNPDNGGAFERITINPIASKNLVAGDYEGAITLVSLNATTEIPVSLKVVESIDAAFKLEAVNFCGDNLENSFIYSNKDYERAALGVDLTYYDYNNFGKSLERFFRFAFYKEAVSVNVGSLISDFFEQLESPSSIGFNLDTVKRFQIFNYTKPTKLDLSLNIERRDTGEISNSKLFRNLEYIKGRKPSRFSNNYGILDVNDVPVRVTRESKVLFNFFRKLEIHDIKIYRNNVLFKTVSHSPGRNSVFGMALSMEDFKPGDVIDIRLAKNEIENFVKQYLVFPDQAFSNHLAYLDEHDLLQTFECTGEMQITSDYEFITATSFKDFVEKLTNLDSKKEQRLIINTGWILKSNSVIVDNIIRSNGNWLLGENKEISLTPVTSKMVNSDTEQELYAYDLEFIINRESDAKVY